VTLIKLKRQKVQSIARVAAGAFGFLIFSRAFDGPDLHVELADQISKDDCAFVGHSD
jgi:hypothetical protein